MQYTSGTTGFPKGAVLSHRGLTNNARFGLSRMGAKRGDTFLIVLAGRLRLSLHDHLWPDRNLADPDPDAGDRRLDRTNDADGWLHTGDLGTMAARGYVCVTGRLKDMIIRGGENLFPAEIENVLITHPDVAEVAVVGVPDPRWGEVAVAFLRPRAAAQLQVADLVRHVRHDLAAPKTPAHSIVLDAFPLTGSGKVQKFVLRDRYLAGEFSGQTLR